MGVEKFLPHPCGGPLSLSSRRWTTAEKLSIIASRNALERNYLGCSLNDGHNRLAGLSRRTKPLALDILGECYEGSNKLQFLTFAADVFDGPLR
jgi:hypothetical protein